ncbi:flagellar protein FlaG [Alkalicoccobacillus plakortidis]|uniref:Flagellar protein FlaG n=1 Tax=Alkalicoccobacillus plakortidis TaxID=444060 RepID=A0ABT0XIF3_9BACI|nr:flagellar protein FlaG [Alkalicoccobacillus plakortidis]MCM2675693.1 flagellar protein FlaG [Alkalicoccobacillus plakortidis]
MDIQPTSPTIPDVNRAQAVVKANHQQKPVGQFDPKPPFGNQEKALNDVENQIESMNDLLSTTPTSIKFNMHKDLDRIYVQVVDLQTKEVVKEIPPEEFLDMVASMLKNAGLIVDERV